uniref:RING-type domain-containing protein n=1 Tax=viral metagenome TaxID=1070528 RepID=A0A6C0JSN3_9ZZZZ
MKIIRSEYNLLVFYEKKKNNVPIALLIIEPKMTNINEIPFVKKPFFLEEVEKNLLIVQEDQVHKMDDVRCIGKLSFLITKFVKKNIIIYFIDEDDTIINNITFMNEDIENLEIKSHTSKGETEILVSKKKTKLFRTLKNETSPSETGYTINLIGLNGNWIITDKYGFDDFDDFDDCSSNIAGISIFDDQPFNTKPKDIPSVSGTNIRCISKPQNKKIYIKNNTAIRNKNASKSYITKIDRGNDVKIESVDVFNDEINESIQNIIKYFLVVNNDIEANGKKIFPEEECVICFEEKGAIDGLFDVCGHNCIHFRCFNKDLIKVCPICRAKITTVSKLK